MMRTKFVINPITGELDLITRIKYNQLSVDFGTDPVQEGEYVFTDPFVTPQSIMDGEMAYAQAAGKDLDEATMDAFSMKFMPGNGQFTVYFTPLEGRVYGQFVFNYSVM